MLSKKTKDFYLKLKEDLNAELKSASKGLPLSLWETYSAFSNTKGGIIYLGIKEGSPNKLIGVHDADKLKREFFSTINNKEKVNKNLLSDNDFQIVNLDEGITLIEIHIKEASVYDKPIYLNGSVVNSYKRNYEGDFKIDNLTLLSFIDDAKVISNDSLNNKLNIGYSSVDRDTLKLFRDDLNKANPNNIFKNENDKEFLIKSGYLNVNDDEKLILTNAGVFLFTSPSIIKRINPNYFLDYKEMIDEDDETWIDRLTSDDIDYNGNLYFFYLKVIDKLTHDLPKPFYLKGLTDIGQSEIISMVREGFINALTNCDFLNACTLKIIKTKSKIIFINSGRLKIPFNDAIKYGNSDPRNKSLMATFRNLKLTSRECSGLQCLLKLSKDLNLYQPILIDDPIKSETKLTIFLKAKSIDENDKIKLILNYFSADNRFISIGELAKRINLNRTTTSILVNELINDNILISNNQLTKAKKVKLK